MSTGRCSAAVLTCTSSCRGSSCWTDSTWIPWRSRSPDRRRDCRSHRPRNVGGIVSACSLERFVGAVLDELDDERHGPCLVGVPSRRRDEAATSSRSWWWRRSAARSRSCHTDGPKATRLRARRRSLVARRARRATPRRHTSGRARTTTTRWGWRASRASSATSMARSCVRPTNAIPAIGISWSRSQRSAGTAASSRPRSSTLQPWSPSLRGTRRLGGSSRR